MKRTGSLGELSFTWPITAGDIGVGTCPDSELVKAYLQWSEGYAEYWLQMRNGAVLLQMVPGCPNSGAIYLLDSTNRTFYLADFELGDTDLNKHTFERLVAEYGLLDYASNPCLIEVPVREAAMA